MIGVPIIIQGIIGILYKYLHDPIRNEFQDNRLPFSGVELSEVHTYVHVRENQKVFGISVHLHIIFARSTQI